MKKGLSVILSVIIVLTMFAVSVSAVSNGTTYYVDAVNGEDLNDGTSEVTAWRTLRKAESFTYSEGDKILFRAGQTFSGTFTAKGSGTAENPIILGSYGDINNDGKPLFFTRGELQLLTLMNVSGWTVENLEFVAPDGKGILILCNNGKDETDITVQNCSLHNIWYHATEVCRGDCAALFIGANGAGSRLVNLKLSGLEIYDCAYAIHMFGNTIEWAPDIYVSPEVSYSQNFVFENLALNNILYDGMAICSVNNLLIKNTSLIKTSLNTEYYTAPIWSHHAKNMTIENCEVAGATNYKDGMTVDFDGWTTDSVYQYIYSHDNVRFMQNCVYDDTTRNENCTVRYCLSVNDNVSMNNVALCNSASYTDEDNPSGMYNFKFYNNTIVNSLGFKFYALRDSVIENNIFSFSDDGQFILFAKGEPESKNDRILGIKASTFTGVVSNNCFYKFDVPITAKNCVVTNPLFTGKDYTDKNSFVLSKNSPLIGKGLQVEENMGEHDFYGNPITSETVHNIGCYEGSGVDDGQIQNVCENIFSCVTLAFKKLLTSLQVLVWII